MVEEVKEIQINWKTINNLTGYTGDYNQATDILLIQTTEDRPAVSIDCDGEFWIRVDPGTGEILGVEIEDFKKVFLPKHAQLFNKDDFYVKPVAKIIQMKKCPA